MPKKKEHDDSNHHNEEEIDIGRRDEKTRLNITVNKDAVEQAKAQGINISAAIDVYLQTITLPITHGVLETRAYRINALDKFLDTIKPTLEFLDIELEIGEITDKDYSSKRKLKVDHYGSKIIMDGNSVFFLKGDRRYGEPPEFTTSFPPGSMKMKLIKPEEDYAMYYQNIKYLYRPEKILQNLITAVLRTPKINQKEAQKLKLALKFVKALFTENNDNSSEKGIETPILRQVIASAGKTKSTEIPNPNRRSEVILV